VKLSFALAVAALACSACATANNRIGAQLDNYAGRPVSELFARLGPPDAETASNGRAVYVWGDPRIAALPQMHGAPSGDHEVAAQAETTTNPLACTIRVFAGMDQRVVSWDVLGDERVCQSYVRRLSPRR
jgi:hypothetical protein